MFEDENCQQIIIFYETSWFIAPLADESLYTYLTKVFVIAKVLTDTKSLLKA